MPSETLIQLGTLTLNRRDSNGVLWRVDKDGLAGWGSTGSTLEYRWTPSTSITEVDTLTKHAQAKQIELADGSMPVELVAVVQDAPRLGIDWDIGSDVEWKIGGLDGDGRDTVPQFPGGAQGVARAFGWSMVLSETPTISPTLGVDP